VNNSNSYRGIAYLKRLTRDNLMAGTKMDWKTE